MALQTIPISTARGGLFSISITYDDVSLNLTSIDWSNLTDRTATVTITRASPARTNTFAIPPGQVSGFTVPGGRYNLTRTTGPDGDELLGNYSFSISFSAAP